VPARILGGVWPLTNAKGFPSSFVNHAAGWRIASGDATVSLDPSAVQALQSLALGFAFAGLLASAFELFTARRADFTLLQSGGLAAVASVPVVIFSAPFLILRNTVRGRRIEGRPFLFVMLASLVASLWSMACGRLVLDLLQFVAGA